MAVVFEILMMDVQRNCPVHRIPVQFLTQQEAQRHADSLANRANHASANYRYVVCPLDPEAEPDRGSVMIPPALMRPKA
ncbi:MAG: hypothetical protein IT364_05735 [Candidatus Hydrogenedentes bacterium]|nr:hypothetical protein [Candidatus Hydrogenedentota bacterium]